MANQFRAVIFVAIIYQLSVDNAGHPPPGVWCRRRKAGPGSLAAFWKGEGPATLPCHRKPHHFGHCVSWIMKVVADLRVRPAILLKRRLRAETILVTILPVMRRVLIAVSFSETSARVYVLGDDFIDGLCAL